MRIDISKIRTGLMHTMTTAAKANGASSYQPNTVVQNGKAIQTTQHDSTPPDSMVRSLSGLLFHVFGRISAALCSLLFNS